MMSNPIIADNEPIKVNLAKGQEYHFCTCGQSRSQPFCDGAHAGTDLTPRVIVSDQDQEAYLCACKHTRNAPLGSLSKRIRNRRAVSLSRG